MESFRYFFCQLFYQKHAQSIWTVCRWKLNKNWNLSHFRSLYCLHLTYWEHLIRIQICAFPGLCAISKEYLVCKQDCTGQSNYLLWPLVWSFILQWFKWFGYKWFAGYSQLTFGLFNGIFCCRITSNYWPTNLGVHQFLSKPPMFKTSTIML